MVLEERHRALEFVVIPHRAIENIVVAASLVINGFDGLSSRAQSPLKAARHFYFCELSSAVCRMIRRAM